MCLFTAYETVERCFDGFKGGGEAWGFSLNMEARPRRFGFGFYEEIDS